MCAVAAACARARPSQRDESTEDKKEHGSEEETLSVEAAWEEEGFFSRQEKEYDDGESSESGLDFGGEQKELVEDEGQGQVSRVS